MAVLTEATADVLVVGAGTAGMPCAIAAAEAGARVLVIEKTDEVGGTLPVNFTGQISAAGTRRQRERGIDDSPDEHFDDVMRISNGLAEPALVRLAVDEAAATIDWLDDLGFEFHPDCPGLAYLHETYSKPRTYWGVEGGASILAAIRPRWDELIDEGRIQLRLEHALEDFLIEAGRVVGVRAAPADVSIELRAPSVALTSGGYTANRELFAELTPGSPRLLTNAPLAASGDGLLAARRLGAGFDGAEHTQVSLLGGVALDVDSIRADVFANLIPAERPPREIHVNVDGKRFCAEDDPSASVRESAVVGQPGHRFWIVFDSEALAGEPLAPELDSAGLRSLAQTGEAVWLDDDLSALAAKAGVDPAGLCRTVTEWNAATQAGDDPLGRTSLVPVATPPYFAIRSNALFTIAFGGLTVDSELRITTADGDVIEGLYAAGEVIGVSRMMGNAVCSGMCLTPAMSFGRILGRRLAD